jgi:hypothetical protein
MARDVKKGSPQAATLPDPMTYMRRLHPDLYSDSTAVASVELTKSLLEYHLETLTNRTQESEFAYFARRLAEKEICPNLRPQTGPTGGGDSKADSETIPISSEISELWVGSDPRAGGERWAFAFSAKKKWKSKAASDIRNIAATGRGYSRIYFITNQFAPDKSRAQSEDSLSKETGTRVTILDRSWITEAVIENGHADLAIETLNIEELRPSVERRIGPADLERQQELDELERGIADPEHYRGARYQLVEDALRAALLARGLGRPRVEIDGLFLRADRLASDPEQPRQRLRIAYNYAWTVIFWFNDCRQLNSIYDTVESYGLNSDQVEEVELVQNLWMVLLSQVRRGVLSGADAKLDSRREALVAVLKTLAADITRPNNALQAKTCLTVLSIQSALETGDPSALEGVCRNFNQIATDAERLGDYPFERLAKLVKVLGEVGAESAEFDTLFETIVNTLEKRRGETAGAGLLRDHGFQRLEANRPYEAISLLGRALERFVKREHRDDLIFCMMGLSEAYVMAGLLWAARSCALFAAERCLAYYREEGKLVRFSLSALEQLTSIEVRLGRIAHALMAMELEAVLAPQLSLAEDRRERRAEHGQVTEAMLGIALLSSSLDQLREMDGLPEALEELGLSIPKGFLLYSLGYRDELRNEGFSADKWSNADIDEFMKRALGQPGRLQMPARPQIEIGRSVTYHTTVLGSQITVQAPATRDGISVSEAVLGTIEAFFATSLKERIMPYRAAAKIVVEAANDLTQGFCITEENTEGEAFLRVQYPAVMPAISSESRIKYRNGLMELVPRFIAHTAVIDDIASYLARIADEERGFSRALLYSEVSLAQDNLFGSAPKVLMRDWIPRDGARRFPLNRTSEWFKGVSIEQLPLEGEEEQSKRDAVHGSDFLRVRAGSEKHSDRKIASQIDIPLWNQAAWCAVFYLFDPRVAPHPVLGLGFRNRDAAAKIFQGWRKDLGAEDKESKLRISIIRGIDRANPAAYRVFVSTNVPAGVDSGSLVMIVGRRHTLTPKTTENLDVFLRALEHSGRYLLVPAHFRSETELPELGLSVGILKDQLIVRNAWEVCLNEQDATAFTADDDPLIPPEIKDAPVTAVLAAIRDRIQRG